MYHAFQRVLREIVLILCFFLPRERKKRLERRLRGREDALKLAQADCVVVSYGKSGRTWLRVMISRFYQLKHGLSERHLIGFDNLHRRNPGIPRIFFTHDNYLTDYTGNAGSKTDYLGKKVVLLVRHPADVAVSQYFQWKFRMRPVKKFLNDYPAHGQDISIYDFVMWESSGLPKIIDYLNLWAQEAERIGALHVVRYEDMRADTQEALRGIVEFVGGPADAKTIAESVDFASVENMRALEQKKVFWLAGSRMAPGDKSNPNSFKVRRAKVGGYRDYFDDAQVARIETLIAERLDPSFGYGQAEGGAQRAGEDSAASG